MKVRLARRFRHFGLKCLFAVALAAPITSDAAAEEFGCIEECGQILSSCEFEIRDAESRCYEEELCGWTHDSCPIAPPPVASRTSSQFDQSMAAAAATACAHAGIYVEQIVEPFAMVGPQVVRSLESVKELQDWWSVAIEKSYAAESDVDEVASDVDQPEASAVTESVIREELDALAKEEPVDTSDLGVSVLVSEPPTAKATEFVDASEAQVGASAIIVSIEDTYLPYDLSARDLQVWSVFPLVTEPFCVRGRSQSDVVASMWEEYDQVKTSDIQQTPAVNLSGEQELIESSADCLLDEFVWDLQQVIESDQEWLQPAAYGRQLARLLISSSRIAESAAGRLASVWPDTQDDGNFDEETAGTQLLVRAGAIEASEPAELAPVAAAQIAEVPAGSHLR